MYMTHLEISDSTLQTAPWLIAMGHSIIVASVWFGSTTIVHITEALQTILHTNFSNGASTFIEIHCG